MKRLNEEYESWEVEFWQELEKYITESKDLAAKLQHKEIEFRLKTEELKRAIEKLEFKNKDYLNQNRTLNETVIKQKSDITKKNEKIRMQMTEIEKLNNIQSNQISPEELEQQISVKIEHLKDKNLELEQ